MRWCSLLLLCWCLTAGAQEQGKPPVRVYPVADLGPGAEFQNMGVTRLDDGRIVVANTGAVAIYDGARWHTYKHPRGLGTLWSAVPVGERIYAGFSGDIGYFEPDARGGYDWHSMNERLPEMQRDFGTVWSAIAGQGGVWFSAGGQTMWLPPEGPAKVFPTVRFGVFLYTIGDEVWLNDRGVGMLRVEGEDDAMRLVPIRGGEAFNGMPILGATALAKDDVLIGTGEGELHRWTRGVVTPFAEPLWPDLAQRGLQTILALADGHIAIGFLRSGPIVIDRKGRIVERYGDEEGVPPLTTFLFFEDQAENLFVAQNQGLVQIARGLGSTRFDRLSGIPDATCFTRHGGHLFAGGLAGLYRLVPGGDGGNAHFVVDDSGPRNVWQMLSAGDWLWIAGRGLERYSVAADGSLGARQQWVKMQFGKSIHASQHHVDRLYFSGTDGVAIVDASSSAEPKITQLTLSGSPVHLAESGPDEFWVGDQGSMLWRIHRTGSGWQAEKFGAAEGVLGGEAWVQPGRHGLWFLTSAGPMDFDASTKRFVPSQRWPTAAPRERLEGVYEDSTGALWLRAEGRTGVVHPDAPTVFSAAAFQSSDDRSQVVAYYREDDVLWVARSDGVQRLELNRVREWSAPPPRIVTLTDTRSMTRLSLQSEVQMTEAQRDLAIEYAQAGFVASESALFRSRLVGNDDDWSPWGPQISRTYTNLPPGALRFELQARDVFGRTTDADPIVINVPAPWYGTRTAIAGFLLAILALMLLSAQWAARRRQRMMLGRQRELETEVAARTRELAEKNSALEAQALRLREVDQLKSRFFTNVGHEFRTPLTLVLGPLDDVLNDARSRLAERTRDLIELANRNARRVFELLVELLDVNRLEHGQLPMRRQATDLGNLLRSQAEALLPLCERFGHRLEVVVPEELVCADVDAAQIERCIANLVSNAVKYTPRGGAIRVELHARNPARIEVTDHGRGISSTALSHVFDRFFQAEGGDTATGVGIGLALVREIIEGHGGAVGVESQLGLGSRFWFDLPTSTEAPMATTLPPVPLQPATPIEQATPSNVEQPLALVIDDHSDLRLRIRQLLADRFRVIEAADGLSGLALARSELPDIIVSDVMMPGLDGVELAKRLRADAETQAIPLLLLTAKAGADQAVIGLTAGADDYVSKPFDSAELLARIGALIDVRRRLQYRLQREASTPLPLPSADDKWRERLNTVVEHHMAESAFDTDALASAMHMDRSTLFRKLKAQVGMGPAEYLREMRLLRSRDLLDQGAGNVSEVAYAVGFESLSSFSRAYKARFGVPPTEALRRRA